MAPWIINGIDYQYRGGKKDIVYLEITSSYLSRLFGVPKRTINRWIQADKLDPTDLLDIIDKYNNREKLDYRRKKKE